jgi:hypothetical protein
VPPTLRWCSEPNAAESNEQHRTKHTVANPVQPERQMAVANHGRVRRRPKLNDPAHGTQWLQPRYPHRVSSDLLSLRAFILTEKFDEEGSGPTKDRSKVHKKRYCTVSNLASPKCDDRKNQAS